VKRKEVLKRLRTAAKSQGLDYYEFELKKHTAVRIGATTRTIGRHSEIPELTVIKFY
jgi:hypothetical protein